MFDAIVLSKLQYAISVYDDFLSAELKGQNNAFLKRAFKYGFCTSLHTIDVLYCTVLLLLVCVSFTIIGQPRNSVLIRRV